MPTVEEIVAYLGAGHQLLGGGTSVIERGVAIDNAGPGDMAFLGLTARAHDERLLRCRASLLFVDARAPLKGPSLPNAVVRCENPRLAFIRALTQFFAPRLAPGIAPSAVIDPTASVAALAIGPLCTVGAGVQIGEGCVLHAGVHLYAGVRLGRNVTIHAGSVLGADGYGYERDPDGRLLKFPHLGGVVVEDDVEIGANACIDRGTLGDTRIGRGCRIDNLVHIAHNVELGPDCAVIANAMVAGSVRVGPRAWIAPSASVRDGLTVGEGATVGLGAVVTSDVAAGATVMGAPARAAAEFRALLKAFRRLIDGR